MTCLQDIAPLFAGWEETMVWSCLQGVMGRAEANADGSAAMIVNRDFVFLAGKPDPALLAKASGPRPDGSSPPDCRKRSRDL